MHTAGAPPAAEPDPSTADTAKAEPALPHAGLAGPSHDAAKESNLPSRGLPGPASFEDWMGHQARAAPGVMLRRGRVTGPSPTQPDRPLRTDRSGAEEQEGHE